MYGKAQGSPAAGSSRGPRQFEAVIQPERRGGQQSTERPEATQGPPPDPPPEIGTRIRALQSCRQRTPVRTHPLGPTSCRQGAQGAHGQLRPSTPGCPVPPVPTVAGLVRSSDLRLVAAVAVGPAAVWPLDFPAHRLDGEEGPSQRVRPWRSEHAGVSGPSSHCPPPGPSRLAAPSRL